MKRTAIVCGFVLLIASHATTAQQVPSFVQTSFDITGNGRIDTFAESSLDCGTFVCSYDYTVRGTFIDYFFVSFSWDVGFQFSKFNGWLFTGFGEESDSTWNMTGSLANPMVLLGQIDFEVDSPFATPVTGQAAYHAPTFGPVTGALTSPGETLELSGEVTKPTVSPPAGSGGGSLSPSAAVPPDITFSSDAERLFDDSILLTYFITNNTDDDVDAQWQQAGLSGTIAPGGTLLREVSTTRSLIEQRSVISVAFGSEAATMAGPAVVLLPAPVPLPASGLLLLGALGCLTRLARARG